MLMWNVLCWLILLYLLTGLADHITNIFRFFIETKEEKEENAKHKLIEKK